MTQIAEADCTGHPIYHSIVSPIMTWKQCSSCDHIFTDGYFTDEATDIIFRQTNEHQVTGNALEEQRIISAKIIEKVLPYVQSGAWLDVGFGNGSLLLTADEYGFEAVGVDLRKSNVDLLKRFGLEAHCVYLQQFNHPKRFNVISLADVLEHVPYPKDFLKTVYELMSDDGALFISMPNAESILWKAMTKANANPYWGELEHFHNFGRKRLYSLLEECGFTPVRYGISDRYRLGMEVIAKKKT
jgi:cyclopropane fatty-acyl-phospholipid synthase-like methyltransferase